MKCVILAGGRGRRLWPLSRRAKPKQFQKVLSERTMLQETFARMSQAFAPKDIYISTNRDYVQTVREQLPDLPEENMIVEPCLRDTAAGIALVSAVIAARNGSDETVGVFAADHVIAESGPLFAALDKAVAFLDENPAHIVVFGIEPTEPETAYGYLRLSDSAVSEKHADVKAVKKFTEKPDRETARKYLAEGNYYWNAGMFVFRAGEMLEKFRRHLPDADKPLRKISAAVGSDGFEAVLEEQYPEMPKISLDYAVMEKEPAVSAITLSDCGWSDVGSWSAWREILDRESFEAGKPTVRAAKHFDRSSRNLLLYEADDKKLVLTAGVKDLVVVDTPEALLVCTPEQAKNLSSLLDELETDEKLRRFI